MAQALYRKWRPQSFDDVVGQEQVTTTLKNQIATGRVGHAYLFVGSRGCGKTTSARILAKEVNVAGLDPKRAEQLGDAINEGRALDVIEIDAASHTGVDAMRDILDRVNFQPNELRYKIYVIDECFRYADLVTLASGHKLPIGQIVEEQLDLQVLSYNERTQHLEPKSILRHMRKQPIAPTLRLTFDNDQQIVCTINHKFYTPVGQVCAGHLEVGQAVYACPKQMPEPRAPKRAPRYALERAGAPVEMDKRSGQLWLGSPADIGEWERGDGDHAPSRSMDSGQIAPGVSRVRPGWPGILAVSVVTHIEHVERPEWVYNLEVAGNHNYFVNGILVSNCHMLSVSAFNAMLKTLEEPPPHVIFILATTDPQKIPPTVLSRCQRFTFKRVPVDKIVGRLRTLCEAEGIEADETALRLIARYATGSLRDAVSLLDQLASSNSSRITPGDVREALGATDAGTVRALVDGLIAKDVPKGLDAIQDAIDGGADARQIARQMVEYLRSLLQIKVSDASSPVRDLSEAERIELSAHAGQMRIAQMTKAVRAFSEAINDMRGTTDAQLPLEMAYLECVVDDEARPAYNEPQLLPPSAARAGAGNAKVEAGHARSSTVSGGERMAPETAPAVSAPLPATNLTAAASSLPAQADTSLPGAGTGRGTSAGASADTGSGSSLSLEAVKAQWRQIIKEVKAQNIPAAALLNSCHLHDVTGNVVSIGADHELFRQRLDEARNKNAVVAVLNRMFNGKFDLRVFVNSAAQTVDPDDDPVVKAAKQQGGVVRR